MGDHRFGGAGLCLRIGQPCLGIGGALGGKIGLPRRRQHQRIDGVMAVILTVLRIAVIVIRQQVLQAPFGPDQGGQAAGKHVDFIGIDDRREIALGDTGKPAGFIQQAGLKPLARAQPLPRMGLKAPPLGPRQARRPLDDSIPVVLKTVDPRARREGFIRRLLALGAIGKAHAERLVGGAVVPAILERNQMFDFDVFRKQPGNTDALPRKWTPPIERIFRI